MEYGLYLHIPFCKKRCHYCSFTTCGGYGQVPGAYVSALLRDIGRLAPRGTDGKIIRPVSVYFGGGTPSLLEANQVRQILDAIGFACDVKDNKMPPTVIQAEITLEANPESLNEQKLRGYYQAGVNRLSIGLQTAREDSLKILGRLHTAQQANNAIYYAKKAGFHNISGDIMLNLPGYTNAEFDESLELLHKGGITHISAYMLHLEKSTPLGQKPPPNIPSDDQAADIYLYAVGQLANAGYAQYEISNFAKTGYQSRHNLLYWNAKNWLGIGPAAHSHMCGRRFSFSANTSSFVQNSPAATQESPITAQDFIMLQLRLSSGLCLAQLKKQYGYAFSSKQMEFIKSLCTAGHARLNSNTISLSPSGMLVQNSILGRLFV